MPEFPRLEFPGIAFIGGGNMARALIGGLLKHGVAPATISVSEPWEPTRAALARDFPIRIEQSNLAAARDAKIWLLAVKPQMMQGVLGELRSFAGQQALVVSIAAGIPLQQLRAGLGPGPVLVRAMPNTPALVGAGISVLCAEPGLSAQHRAQAQALLATVGSSTWIDDESLMDAVTAVSGSGPAYFFRLMEGIIEGALAAGLPPAIARELVLQTALGAAQLAQQSEESPGELRARVTSPGGTTAAALAVLDQGGFASLVAAAVAAATARGKALAQT